METKKILGLDSVILPDVNIMGDLCLVFPQLLDRKIQSELELKENMAWHEISYFNLMELKVNSWRAPYFKM